MPTKPPTNKPRNESFTQDVIARGADAFKDRRASQQYDRAMYQQAFGQMGGQYQPYAPSGQYGDWRASQGFMPVDYAPTFGRGDGPYAGFKTQEMLKSAIQGRGEYMREQDRLQAQALQQMANKGLDSIESQYTSLRKKLDPTAVTVGVNKNGVQIDGAMLGEDALALSKMQHMPSPGSSSDMEKSTLNRALHLNSNILREKHAQQNYNDNVGRWAADAADPYFKAVDFGNEVASTPLRDYATKAAAEYGVDPMVARGWYDENSQLQDYRDQRDLQSIQDFGAPYADYQSAYNTMLRQQNQATNDQQDADLQAKNDYIMQATGLDPQQLASGAKMDVNGLYEVMGSQAYLDASTELQNAGDIGGADEINKVLQNVLRQDPALYRVLKAQYGWYADALGGA